MQRGKECVLTICFVFVLFLQILRPEVDKLVQLMQFQDEAVEVYLSDSVVVVCCLLRLLLLLLLFVVVCCY